MLKNANILVTGGAGFIGSHIVDLLLKEDVKQVIVLDSFISGKKENLDHLEKNRKVKIVRGDIRDKNIVNKCVMGVDIIFHQAALRHFICSQDPRLGHEILVDGTFNIFEAAVKHKIKKIIFASSASVYGSPKKMPMSENDALLDDTMYGAAKIYSEKLAAAFYRLYNIPFVGLRYFNVYGPRVDTQSGYPEVIIRWVMQILNNISPEIYGDGKQTMDFIYVQDIAKANILAAQSDAVGVYNVGSGKQTSLLEIYDLLVSITHKNIKPVFKPAPKLSLANKRKADIKLASMDLGFLATFPLKEGIKNLVEWYISENILKRNGGMQK